MRLILHDALAILREFEQLDHAVNTAQLQVPFAAVQTLEEAAQAHERIAKSRVLGGLYRRPATTGSSALLVSRPLFGFCIGGGGSDGTRSRGLFRRGGCAVGAPRRATGYLSNGSGEETGIDNFFKSMIFI